MAPHLTKKEIDTLRVKSGEGKTPIEIHTWLEKARRRQGIESPNLTNVRKLLNGKTYKGNVREARGRKRILTRKHVLKLNTVRKRLLKKTDGEDKVTWGNILRVGRLAKKVSAVTVAKNFLQEGIDVKWRTARESQTLDAKQKKERFEITGRWKYYADNYFNDEIDAILDCKKFPVPTHARALGYVKKIRIKGHLRTRSEGTASYCKKPNTKRNRVNAGGGVSICAGIINGKLHLWHHLKKAKWNGQVAADLYRGPLKTALEKHRGKKGRYLVLEDNDPSGFKSKKAEQAKKEVHIRAVPFPKYSPDLNPLDFHVWHAVEEKVIKKLKGPTSVKKFKELLRRTAKSLKEDDIRAAVSSIKARAKAVHAAGGGGLIAHD